MRVTGAPTWSSASGFRGLASALGLEVDVRFWLRFGLAVVWMVVTVALLTGWDLLVRHLPFSPAKLIFRVVVFLIAAMLLSLLLGRVRNRR